MALIISVHFGLLEMDSVLLSDSCSRLLLCALVWLQQQQDVLLKHDVKDETAAPGCHAADR